ncbi:MAG: exodeoxyribonuclease VII small subunit [Clostridiales bacterium]|nr:exodeoxyribonuclease VII small subunit [Clostridiales bacterium]
MADEVFVYEDAVKELESIVARLGEGNVSLDESLKLYTRGVELASKCDAKLSEVDKKISMLDTSGLNEIPFENGDEG